MTTEKIIEKIDNYLEEPHSLSASWVEALQICRQALIENKKLTYEVDRLKASAEYAYNRGKDEGKKELAVKEYYSALKAVHKNPHDMEARFRLNEVKSFFLSDWFFTLTEGDGRIFIEKIEKRFKEKYKCELL